MFDRRRWIGGLAATLALIPPPALAHSEFGGAAPFWAGALHVLTSPLSLAAMLGLGAALHKSSNAGVLWGLGLGGAAAFAASWSAGAWVAAAAFGPAAAGAAAALGRPAPAVVAASLGLVAGASAGAGAALDPPPTFAATLGVATAAALVAIWTVELAARLPTALALAPRVLGAWCAAIGLLIAALVAFTPN